MSQQGPDARYSHVRVLCLDEDGRILLMKWRDPLDGHDTWEPPGGGVEPGERLVEAAQRELREETGIVCEIRDNYVLAARDDTWRGERRARCEPCFFAAVGDADVAPQMPTSAEADTLVEWRFVREADLAHLDAPIYPPDPFGLVCALIG